MSPENTYHPGAPLVASARARGLFGWLLFAAVAIFGVASAQATSIPLYSFNGSDGLNPFAGLVQGRDGNFYGATLRGGTGGMGTVFKITSGGTLNTLHSFSNDGDGEGPFAGLVQGSDGNFYGTTIGENVSGGASNSGTVFKITPGGSLTTLYNFSSVGWQQNFANSDGAYPYAGLVQGSDGDFYGTTLRGGASGAGTVFKIASGGSLTTLYIFNYTDGAYPYATLVQGRDGNFYGTTFQGGPGASSIDPRYGTVFKITSGGSLTTLYSFTEGSDGRLPRAGLVQGSDGTFYGTTSSGGGGTVFKITSGGSLTTLHVFNFVDDGGDPTDVLVQGSDGNFYGTTSEEGPGQYGTVFKITAGGSLTTLYSFNGSDGGFPYAGLVQGSDGTFYGTTYGGGASGVGTVFKITVYPANKDQCKDNEWMNFIYPRTFNNQGDCIQFVNTGK